MKKIICMLFTTFLLMTTAMPAMANANITVKLDGKAIAFDVPPQIINDRTMVPLRAIFEALGATVDWDASTRTVTSEKDGVTIRLTVDQTAMYVNGKNVTLDSPACIVEDRTLVPVRAISEAYGTKVEWDENTRVVSITTGSTEESYDDISANIEQIRHMIDDGMYLEAIQECEQTKAWHKLSDADIALLDELKEIATHKYNEYIESTSSNSGFETLKKALRSKGRYSDGQYVISYTSRDVTTFLAYDVVDEKIVFMSGVESRSGTMLTSLTIRENEDPIVMIGIEGELIFAGEYPQSTKRLRVTYSLSNSLSNSATEAVTSFCEMIDLILQIKGIDVQLIDLGISY